MNEDKLKKHLGIGAVFKKEEEEKPAPTKKMDYEENISREEFLADFVEKQRKPKVEDTHIRRTYLVNRQLDYRLKKLADKKAHGFRTHFINKAIEDALRLFENEK